MDLQSRVQPRWWHEVEYDIDRHRFVHKSERLDADILREFRADLRKFEQSKARRAFRRRIVNLIVLAALTGIIYALSPLP